MDKFLMSSPAQLSQPFDVGSSKNTSNESDNSGILHLSNVEMYESQFNATIGQETLLPPDIITSSKQLQVDEEDLSLDDSNEFEQELMVPVSNNSNNTIHNSNKSSFYLGGADFDSMSIGAANIHNSHSGQDHQQFPQKQFASSRNLFIDDGIYGSQLLSGNSNLAAGFEHGHHSQQYQQHQANQSLDGRYNHQQNFSISSNFSISQEPPSSQHIPQSISTNTLYSVESIPQLSSSVSNQSLSDSPSSLPQQQQHQHQHQHQQHQSQGQSSVQQYQQTVKQHITATPRKGGRKKSLSVSSTTNLYNTPLRIPANAMSPVNLANPTQNSKIGKTPHSTKGKGHTRSRSRMSIDVTSTPAATASLLNANLSLATKSSSVQNLHNLDPFYTPSSYISPHPNHKTNLELDDIGTPLLTPNHVRNNHHNSGMMSQNNSTYFSPINPGHLNSSGANTSINSNGLPFVLKRHDTLESIKIEDQDDDALKQLKKAKSYSSIANASKKLSISSSNTSKQTIHNINEMGNFDDLTTLNLQIPTQQELQSVGLDDSNLYSSSSTPGIYYSQNSPSVTFGQPLNLNEATVKSLSVPNTANIDHDANIFKANTNKGIDLLSPSFINGGSTETTNHFSKNLTKNLNQSSSFTKSYPASIDLASIATSPVTDTNNNGSTTMNNAGNGNNNNHNNIIPPDNNNSNSLNVSRPPSSTSSSQLYSSAMTPLTHTTTNTSINNPQQVGLLPPMATFPVAASQQDYYNNYSIPIAANVMTGASTLPTTITQSQASLQDIIVTGSSSTTISGPQRLGSDEDIIKPKGTTKSKKSDKEIDVAKEAKKRHKCPICDSRFQRPEHVKRHLKSHSSEKPFECDEPDCGKRFNRKDNLKAHLKKIHQRTFTT